MRTQLLQQLSLLYRLQLADSGVDERRRALACLDDGGAARAELAEAEEQLAAAAEKLRRDRAALRDKELRLSSTEKDIADKRDQAYGGSVTDPKKLAALERKIEELTQLKGKLEEEILLLMDEVEEEATAVEQMQGRVEQLRQRVQEIEQQYAADQQRLNDEITALAAEREEIARQVEPGLLRVYEQLRGKLGGVAVAAIENGMCSACHTAVPRDIDAKIAHSSVPVRCENCHRILWIVGLERSQ
ncbi:MAG: hypothetical protein H5T86_05875 [Armatimonadetes bacterium]|nr:hypothetical protein [Armatimonadota bacterium]